MRVGVLGQQARLQLNQVGPDQGRAQDVRADGALEIFCPYLLQIRKLSLPEKNHLPESQAHIRSRASPRDCTFHTAAEDISKHAG